MKTPFYTSEHDEEPIPLPPPPLLPPLETGRETENTEHVLEYAGSDFLLGC